jgi:PhzF family phenazine biosynthesis protein
MSYPYLLVDAFTQTAGTGNRVALLLDARGMDSDQMMALAAKLGQGQLAFVNSWESESFGVRFFTPGGEVEFSGHAAVALGLTLAREGYAPENRDELILQTPTERLAVRIERNSEGQPVKATVRGPAPRFRDPPQWQVVQQFTEAMGANERYLHRGLPYGVAFTGLWTLFLPFVAPGLVDELEPDMQALVDLCASLDIASVHTYAQLGPRSFYARHFAPLLGIPEDPVTGSANAALGGLLTRAGVVPRWEGQVNLTVLQGHRMGHPGTVEVRVEYGPSGAIQGIYLTGTAVLAQSGIVELPSDPL